MKIGVSYDGVIICDFKSSCIFFSHKEFFDLLIDYLLLMKNIVSEELKSTLENAISIIGQIASCVG